VYRGAERILRAGFLLALTATVMGGLVCFVATHRFLRIHDAIVHEEETLAEIAGLAAAAKLEAIRCHAYLLTADRSHLHAYREARATATQRLERLRRLCAFRTPDAAQVAAVAALLDERDARLAAILAAADGTTPAAAATESPELQRAGMQLESAFVILQRGARQRLATQLSGSRRAVSGALLSLAALVAAALAFPILAWRMLRRMLAARRIAETALRRSHGILHAITESTLDALHLKGRDGRYLLVNTACARQLGRPAAEVIGRTAADLSNGGRTASVADAEREVLESGLPETFEETVMVEGEPRTFLSTHAPCRDEQGRVMGIIGVSRDITERKQAEDDLRHLTNALMNAVEGIARIDDGGRYLTMNRSYCAMTGFGHSELVGAEWWRTIHPDDRAAAEAALNDMTRHGRAEIEVRGLRRDGSVFHKHVLMVPVLDPGGEFRGHYRFTKDVTERRRQEKLRRHLEELERSNQQLERSRREQLAMKDRFISHVSHELRSPLTVIHDFVTILQDGLAGDMNPTQQEYVEILRRNVDQLVSMISDLLDVTRLQTGKLELERTCLPLAAVLREAADSFRSAAGARSIELVLEAPDDLPPAYGDGRRVRQVLDNLIGNALKFTSQGSIRLAARLAPGDPATIEVAVEDSGCGIPPEEASRIFDSLYQGSGGCDIPRRGLGLGLFITRDLVERHGGRIWVESEPGRGSAFRFTLPVFSIAFVLHDLVRSRPLWRGPAALLRIELSPGERRSWQPADEDALDEAYDCLRRHGDSEREALLPRCGRGNGRETFLILLRNGSAAAGPMLERVTRELMEQPGVVAAGLRVTAYATVVELDGDAAARPGSAAHGRDESPDDAIAAPEPMERRA
jgi:PAS domain S-box-containing protein